MTGDNLDASYGHSEVFCDDSAHRLIGLFINWRGGDPHKQTPSSFTTNLIPFRAWDHPYRQPQRSL